MSDLVATLRSASGLKRLEASERLSHMPAASRIDPLAVVALDASTPIAARTNAIYMLGRCGAAATGPVARLLSDAAPEVRAAALAALAEVDPRALAPRLTAFWDDASPLVRREVVKNLRAAPDRERLLQAALADSTSSVRREALRMIARLPAGGWSGELAKAFTRVRIRSGAERGGLLEMMIEEEAALGALLAAAGEPELPDAVAPLAPRLIEIAGDPDAYDTDDHVEAGKLAAELLAMVGVPRAHLGALETLLLRVGLKRYVIEQIVFAIVKSAPDEATKIFARTLARGSHVPDEILRAGLDRARAQTRRR